MRQLQWDQELARLVNLLRILVELVTIAGAATLADQQTLNSPDFFFDFCFQSLVFKPLAIIAP